MNKNNFSESTESEIQWLQKSRYGLRKINRQDLDDKVISDHTESIQGTKNLMETLNSELSKSEIT
jgi:hypothetical protein